MGEAPLNGALLSARDAGLVGCHRCGAVHPPDRRTCQTCGATLRSRRPGSLQSAWAWWITGLVFYIPANLFPLLNNRILGGESGHTIIEGVLIFFASGDYLVAIVIMTASLLIPISKFCAIAFLVLSIQFRWPLDAHLRLVLYEAVEFIGRWSMIDVFVVALLAALVNLGGIVAILAGPGSVCFALSVIFTMVSANSIDTKRIWDAQGKELPHE